VDGLKVGINSKGRIMNINKLIFAVVILLLLGTVACEDDTCTPCDKPPISILTVEVTDFSIFAILMYPYPDQIECQLTLRIENTSSKYSYSDISISTGYVYLSSDNQLLGEITFETDWDGTIDDGEVVTVLLTKIIEDSQIFQHPCWEDVYVEFIITTSGYGEIKQRTPTYNFSCLI
jgi:hypothetical protein